MKNYIELAHSTSAPVDPCRKRLNGPLLAMLFYRMEECVKLAEDLDQLKRAIFYGKPEVVGNITMPTDADEHAHHAFRDDIAIELLHAGLGMATEAGEFLRAVGDHVFDGLEIDTVNIGEEIGDALYYLAKAAKFTGTTLEAEMERNIAKLRKRYPKKFTEDAALNRDLDSERKVLESTAG